MKMTEPYSPTARANASANPVSSAGIRLGRITRNTVCQRLAPKLAAASSISTSRSISTGCTVRTTKGMPMKTIAMKMPIGVNATLMPSSASGAPSQPFCANSCVSATPATAVGKRKGNIDDGVEQPPAGKAIAHQRPDDDGSHHQIDEGGRKRKPERNLQRIERAAAGDDAPELIKAEFEGLEKQAGQRHQDDNGEPCQGQSHGETKPRQRAAPCNRYAHKSPCLLGKSLSNQILQISSCRSGRKCRLRRNGPSAPWSNHRKRRRW